MTTNATLIDDSLAKALYCAGLASVTVSIDGLEASHDWFRNSRGAFRQAEKGLYSLVKNAPGSARVDVLTVVHKRNLAELEKIYRFVNDSGVKSWRIVNMEPIGRATQNSQYMLDADEFKMLLDFVQEKHFSSETVRVDYGCAHYLMPKYERMLRPYCFSCMAGLQVAGITCNGDIIACLDIERRADLVQGNIERDDFWNVCSNRFQVFRTNRAETSEYCKYCADRRFCAGDSAYTWDYDNNRPILCLKDFLNI